MPGWYRDGLVVPGWFRDRFSGGLTPDAARAQSLTGDIDTDTYVLGCQSIMVGQEGAAFSMQKAAEKRTMNCSYQNFGRQTM